LLTDGQSGSRLVGSTKYAAMGTDYPVSLVLAESPEGTQFIKFNYHQSGVSVYENDLTLKVNY